jgi:archaellum component FlaG (FlaF/FlaG flagellin family)
VGETIHSHGRLFENGLVAHAPSEVSYALAGNFTRLSTTLVVYNEGNSDCGDGVVFKVLVDGALTYESQVMLPSSDPAEVEISLPAGEVLTLVADPQADSDCDFAIWGDPILLP